MCGLFGFAVAGMDHMPDDWRSRGLAALATLAHRGPDQQNHFVSGGVFMGHTRLAVLDLSDSGMQPMTSSDGLVATTVNGEIYNFRDLREHIGKGKFRSECDSEVVLHGYRSLGFEHLLEVMDGMYAGVVYDADAGAIHLFRDRVGIKPLFLCTTQYHGLTALVWASELKAIEYFVVGLQVDETALLDFAAQRCVPAPKTIYKTVSKLLPAHMAGFSLTTGSLTQRRYWSLPVSSSRDSTDVLAERLREAIGRSVRQQLVADVPVGVFLSGGIDSSIISSAAAEGVAEPLQTYTIGFAEGGRDESPYARIMADRLRSKHVERIMTSDEVVDVISLMRGWYDEPFGDLSALPTAKVCALARTSSVVVLSGDGGDELFGGYTWYQRFQRFRRLNKLFGRRRCHDFEFRRPPVSIRQKVLNRVALLCQFDPMHLYAATMSNLLSGELNEVREWLEIPKDYDCLWSLRRYYRPELGTRKCLQYLDFHTWLPDDILTKVDRVSMAVSLEVRVPFLSREVCELAFGLPESFIYRNGQLKGGLKYAYRDALPREILHRPKRGFSIPISWWKDELLAGHPGYVHYFLSRVKSLGVQAALE